jgi:SAM-dependent methyltransferase
VKSALYVQYGCGLSAPDGWKNFDASPTLRIQRLPGVGRILARGRPIFPPEVQFGDVIKGLPVQDQTCVAVYCSHVLEHLSLEDFRKALHETYRILQPGGVFRGVLPDLEELAKTYVSDTSDEAAMIFMKQSLLGVPQRPRGLRGLVEAMFGNSHHLWMWDYKSIAKHLRQAGFESVRRAQMGDGQDTMFARVEDQSRWTGCLGFEAVRPQ